VKRILVVLMGIVLVMALAGTVLACDPGYTQLKEVPPVSTL